MIFGRGKINRCIGNFLCEIKEANPVSPAHSGRAAAGERQIDFLLSVLRVRSGRPAEPA